MKNTTTTETMTGPIPETVSCPACKAYPGEPCHFTPYRPNRKVSYHAARVTKAYQPSKAVR